MDGLSTSWTREELIAVTKGGGNIGANKIYEGAAATTTTTVNHNNEATTKYYGRSRSAKNLEFMLNFTRPVPDESNNEIRERFVRDKYQKRKFFSKKNFEEFVSTIDLLFYDDDDDEDDDEDLFDNDDTSMMNVSRRGSVRSISVRGCDSNLRGSSQKSQSSLGRSRHSRRSAVPVERNFDQLAQESSRRNIPIHSATDSSKFDALFLPDLYGSDDDDALNSSSSMLLRSSSHTKEKLSVVDRRKMMKEAKKSNRYSRSRRSFSRRSLLSNDSNNYKCGKGKSSRKISLSLSCHYPSRRNLFQKGDSSTRATSKTSLSSSLHDNRTDIEAALLSHHHGKDSITSLEQ
jgi:hypothetical protein